MRFSKGYCGLQRRSYIDDVKQFFIITFVSDLYEWSYHYLGHQYKFFWQIHKFHHKFHNPTPFAVIADCATDNFMRALPIFFFPLVMEVNLDIFNVYRCWWGCGGASFDVALAAQ